MLRVLQMGLGPIGKAIARRVQRHAELELVGAVDPDPEIAGVDLGQLLRGDGGGMVLASAAEFLARDKPDVVINATGSALQRVAEEIRPLLEEGISVVSTCEELSYPFYRHPELARELDTLARLGGAVVLGTGVNPGFVMDKLVATMMAACDSIRSVRVTRIVDASRRRLPLQRKIGAGIAPAEFERRREQGSIGHVGLAESAHMLADVMGVSAQRTLREELRPVIAERRIVGNFLAVEAGQVAGIDQTATIVARDAERARLELRMSVGPVEARDEIAIEGAPPLQLAIESGVPGDECTAAVTINCAVLLPELRPGLRTMLDVPLRPCPGS